MLPHFLEAEINVDLTFSASTTRNALCQGSADDMDYYVAVSNGQFVVNCKTFYVSGWNQWETVEAAAGALQLYGASLPPNTTGPALVRQLLDRAVANGFTVMRAWATAVSPQYALEVGRAALVCGEDVRRRGLEVAQRQGVSMQHACTLSRGGRPAGREAAAAAFASPLLPRGDFSAHQSGVRC